MKINFTFLCWWHKTKSNKKLKCICAQLMDWMWHVPMEVGMYNAAYTGCQINGIIWAFWNTCGTELKSFKEPGKGWWPSIFKRLKKPSNTVGKTWQWLLPPPSSCYIQLKAIKPRRRGRAWCPWEEIYKNTDSPGQGAGGLGTQMMHQALPVLRVRSNLPAKLEDLPWGSHRSSMVSASYLD